MKKVAVVYGGWSSEADISRKSGKSIASALRRLGFNVLELELTRDIATRLLEINPDFVFPVLHGKPGEDGTFQGMLEILGIPYVGENHKVSSLCMDKDLTKRLLKEHGIKTPRWVSVKRKPLKGLEDWNIYPAVVKPSEGGSSIGLNIVNDKSSLMEAVGNLLKFSEKAIVEEFIYGEEYTCGFVSGRVFTPLKIVPQTGIYDFKAKYTKGLTNFFPEKGSLGEKIKQLTLKVVEALEIENICRVDFRYNPKKGEIYVLEINTIPGMTETSLLPQMANIDEITFEGLIKLIISAKGFNVELSSNFNNDGRGQME